MTLVNYCSHPPQISIIIPLYNKAPYINRALNSVLSQTVKDFEIIVVGGNSTDGSEDIVLNNYSDSRIRFVKETGKGVSAARNQGIKAARADLVAFLDADDEWSSNFLEIILELNREYPNAGFYTTSWSVCYKSNLTVPKKCFGIKEGWKGIVEHPFKIVAYQRAFPGTTSTTVVKKSAISKIGGFLEGYPFAEDRDLWSRLHLYYDNAHAQIPCVIYYKNIDGQATSDKNIIITKKDPFLHDSLVKIPKTDIDNYHNQNDLELYIDAIQFFLATGDITSGNIKAGINTILKMKYKKIIAMNMILYILRTPKSIILNTFAKSIKSIF